MEEIKTKKKLNKKPLIICLVLALVFGIVGFVDIKSNAAESSGYSATVKAGRNNYNTSGSFTYFDGGTYELTSDSPMYGFYYRLYDTPTNIPSGVNSFWFVISKNNIYGYESNSTKVFVNGEEWYYIGSSFNSSGYNVLILESDELKIGRVNVYYDNVNNLINDYVNGDLDYTKEIDYDNLPTDDDIPCVSEIKRNYIINHYSSPGEEGITQPSDTYEYLIWVNSSDLPIQLEVIPVVQYYKTLFGKSDFLEEYIGEWRDFELLDSGTTKYLRQTDDASLLEKYNEDYQFKKTCLSERSVNIFTETAYFFYGYRIRYVDVENEKAGPWTVVMPSQTVNESEKWQEYSDGSVSNSSNSSGEISDTNYGDVDKNIEEIDETINFKDKYDVVDGNADTQQVMNWLNTVVSFIKGTPNIVTSVLSFLPQPILYGMYITIFLGCIASAIAIVKALI